MDGGQRKLSNGGAVKLLGDERRRTVRVIGMGGDEVAGGGGGCPVVARHNDHIEHFDGIIVVVEIFQLKVLDIVPEFVEPFLVVGAGHGGDGEGADEAKGFEIAMGKVFAGQVI